MKENTTQNHVGMPRTTPGKWQQNSHFHGFGDAGAQTQPTALRYKKQNQLQHS
jgi:hypothetical protein